MDPKLAGLIRAVAKKYLESPKEMRILVGKVLTGGK